MKTKPRILLNIIPIVIGIFLSSCSTHDEPQPAETENTVFMYLPWSGNLTDCFYQNIKDIESTICQSGGLGTDRVIVFMSTGPTCATMYEIVYGDGKCTHLPIKTYTNYPFTTEPGLTSLLEDLKRHSPSKKYAMIIGCHGMGWLPVNTAKTNYPSEKYHYEYGSAGLLTRYFGGLTKDYQTDISTLANALCNTGLKMEYILFDDCYMASIEVAYELKDVTDHLIASTCEVMAYGMPYATMGKYLLGTPDYKAVCEEFYKFYSTYDPMPCGTLSVTDCSQLEELAKMMKSINSTCRFDETLLPSLQSLDGYSPTIFFDYGDYVIKLLDCNHIDESVAELFQRQLAKTVPFKTNTEKYFTVSSGPLPIRAYSGITTSDPSINPKAQEKTHTKWYHATH